MLGPVHDLLPKMDLLSSSKAVEREECSGACLASFEGARDVRGVMGPPMRREGALWGVQIRARRRARGDQAGDEVHMAD